MAFGLRRTGVKDSEVKSRVTEMLELVELPGFERRKPTQISGGQAQRVALARALINRPAVLLLDEPLGALDLKLRKQMQVELKRIQQEVGITFIYVTHDQEEAMTMSDRIAVMNRGRYEQLGDPETLYERPTTRFVAGFLGVSNLLGGHCEGADGDYGDIRLADGTMVLAPAAAVYGRTDGRRRRAAREDPPASRRRPDARPATTISRASWPTRPTWASAPSTSSRPTAGLGSWSTSRTSSGRRRPSCGLAGTRSHLTWSPDHTFVVDDRASRPRRRPSDCPRREEASTWTATP